MANTQGSVTALSGRVWERDVDVAAVRWVTGDGELGAANGASGYETDGWRAPILPFPASPSPIPGSCEPVYQRSNEKHNAHDPIHGEECGVQAAEITWSH